MKVVVGRVSDFENGGRKIVDVNGKSVGVFRIDDQFYAIRNRCPHQWGPLCLGDFAPRAVSSGPGDVHVDDGPPLLACPWHGWEYDLATGQSFAGPGHGLAPALVYDVNVLPGSEVASVCGDPAERGPEDGDTGDGGTGDGGTGDGGTGDGGPGDGSRPRADGRVPGPYVAETLAVSVEQDYVVVEDKPARR
ncbi:MAG TPA: Rieske 2Fe-2S domain-containing protein [Trebonia sp.]|nr:Rieske 2Fe-2S domain-containing protein [Trebonia sp.]